MTAEGDIITGVTRIAVLKAGGLGDVLFAFPALDALRAAYPHAEIALLSSPATIDLLSGRPGPVDRVVPVPPFEDRGSPAAGGSARLEAFCAEACAERFDIALQMHGGGAHSNPFVKRLGARLTAGLRAPDAPPLDRTVPYRYFHSEVLRCLEVAALVGARPVTLEPRLAPAGGDAVAAAAVLPPGTRPLAVVHPGAGDPRRWWPAEKFAVVGRALKTAGADIAVIGTPPERALTAAVCEGVPGAHDLCGRLTLHALAGLLARARVVVSNDSGPLHLARAVGAATVGVYWCGNLVNAGPATVARHPVFAAWRIACPECGADCMAEGCSHDASFVADVDAAEVVTAALELLGMPSAERAKSTPTRDHLPG